MEVLVRKRHAKRKGGCRTPRSFLFQWNSNLTQEESPTFDSMTREQIREYIRNPLDYFDGGHWHVEGTHNERSVTPASCYLESKNVKEERLHFRDGSVGSLREELGTVET
mmetsp:Transcript_12432/g.21769  ORF Transcript_12432/g.21769 Transcript_12432/m.21769 type:complete len:110 (+) Transcript_12432:162-491(+)